METTAGELKLGADAPSGPKRFPISLLVALLAAGGVVQAELLDKTLVAWVSPANLTQRGGSVLTLQGERGNFDGMIFGEVVPGKWMAGSENLRRTQRAQEGWPAETADANTVVPIAIVYRGREVIICRNGEEYSRHVIEEAQPFGAESVVIIGPRHCGNKDFFAGTIDDARIYDRALNAGELAALKPNVAGAIQPWAWWTFDDGAAKDRMGRLAHSRLLAGAKVESGRLVLDGKSGSFWAAEHEEILDSLAPLPEPVVAVEQARTALVAPGSVPHAIRLAGESGWTLFAELGELPASRNVDLAGEAAADGGVRWRLAVSGNDEERCLIFELRIQADPEVVRDVVDNFRKKRMYVTERNVADARAGLFRVEAPLRLIGTGAHTVAVRLIPPAWEMDLYVDGVLLDVEWPLGAMLAGDRSFVPHESVKKLTAETGSLTDGQIVERSGGRTLVKQREEEFLGPDYGCPPFYRPRGYNTHAGDCAPVFDGKRWHLYFLKDRGHWTHRWGWGGLSYGHISSEDLMHWQEHPDATQCSPQEGAIWTGSYAWMGGEYLGCLWNLPVGPLMRKANLTPGVQLVRSRDGVNFTPVDGGRKLAGVDGGDPEIIRLDEGGYGLLTRGDRAGQRQVFFYTSQDLRNWMEEKSPFAFAPPNCDCPHYFTFAGGHYFFAAGVARQSESLRGPWRDITHSTIGVPKTAPFGEGRRILAGMVGDGGWGGDAVFHELVRLPDGSLGEKFVSEMTPLQGELMDLEPAPLIGDAEIAGNAVTVKSTDEFAAAMVDGIPMLARIRLTARPMAGCKTFGLVLRGQGNCQAGVALILNPSEQSVAFSHITGPGQYVSSGVPIVKGVDGLGRPVTFDAILGPNGLVDVEINHNRCFATRGERKDVVSRLFLFAEGGDAVYENVEIRPWTPAASVER